MDIANARQQLDSVALGERLHSLVREWYPIPRSITGDGLREQLRRIAGIVPMDIHEVPSGTPVFDWTIPREWNIRDGYIKDSSGRRLVDFQQHTLHVLGYSVPVRRTMPLAELKEHCFTLPDQPDRIPYRTSYYKENWGFCLTQRQFDALHEPEYEICIDSTLENGALSYGECFLPGECGEEILISAHACHPSLANDNLSGVAVAALLAELMGTLKHRFSYRFVFAPGTIGAITWLARNEQRAGGIRAGLILACLGDSGAITYKQSRRGDAEIDKAAAFVLAASGAPHTIDSFSPYGYDERQYCSPGFNLPMGCLTRTPPGKYPEYHTSADNPALVRADALADSFVRIVEIIEVLEGNARFRNLNPKCEPQLGRRGLYAAIGGRTDTREAEMALLWTLNLSDGEHALLDIAQKARLPFGRVREATDRLLKARLLEEVR